MTTQPIDPQSTDDAAVPCDEADAVTGWHLLEPLGRGARRPDPELPAEGAGGV